jgi:hypothetical protein
VSLTPLCTKSVISKSNIFANSKSYLFKKGFKPVYQWPISKVWYTILVGIGKFTRKIRTFYFKKMLSNVVSET